MAEKEDRMQDLGNTQYFKVETEPETGVKLVLSTVYEALTEKGYNPVNQIVGYIMSGDPTYITAFTLKIQGVIVIGFHPSKTPVPCRISRYLQHFFYFPSQRQPV